MRSGKLDRRIIIERETETVSPAGTVTKTWSQIASVRAEQVEQSTVEAATSFGEAETGTLIFRCRWIPGVEITTQDRVTYAGHAYDLKDIREIGRRHGLELRVIRRTT